MAKFWEPGIPWCLKVTATAPATGEGGSRQTREESPQYVVVVAFCSPNQTSRPWKNAAPRTVTSIPPIFGPSLGMILWMTGGGRVWFTPIGSE